MALIEELVSEVADPDLRMRLQAAVRSLKSNKRFGLVFEDHIPEMAIIPDAEIVTGAAVIDRTVLESDILRVVRTTKRMADVEPLGGGDITRRQLRDLLLVQRFGEPVYPALTPEGSIGDTITKRLHSVICGENYHALQLLTYLHEHQVDVIYIDPPYNTGDKSWRYNNHFVDLNDTFRSSKWLAMMEKRLRLAKRLLKSDGVLVVTIDEHEVLHLGMLLERIFSDADRQLVTIVNNPKGVTRPGTVRFSRVEEYAFFCFMGDARVDGRGDDLLSPGVSDDDPVTTVGRHPRWKGLLRSGTNARRADRIHMFYPVLIDPKRGAVVGAGDPVYDRDPDPEKKIKGFSAAWPIRTDGTWGNWGVGPTTLRDLIAKGFVAVGAYDTRRKTWPLTYLSEDLRAQLASGVLEIASYDEGRNVVEALFTEEASRRLKTVWHRTRHDAGVGGTDILRSFLGDERLFDFPKSIYAVKDTLAALTRHKRDALIVDFFAGSGTTLHATMLLNDEDEGSRRCILITNNEVDAKVGTTLIESGTYPFDRGWDAAGIFEAVCRPRCTAAITGRRPDGTELEGTYLGGRPYAKGFEEAVEFYKLRYLDPDQIDLGWQFEAVLPALWMRAGAVGPRPEFPVRGPLAIPKGSNFAVLFVESSIRKLLSELERKRDVTHVYLRTDSPESFAEMRALLPSGLQCSMLYRDYLRTFSINTEAVLAD